MVITKLRIALVILALLTAACGGTTGAVSSTSTTTTSSTTTTGSPTGADPPPACPGQLKSPSNATLNPAPARPGLADILVPAGPTVLTVCRYAGLNQSVPAGTLVRSTVVTGAPLAALAAYIDQPSWSVIPPGTAYGCPMSEGQVDLLRFAYSAGPGVSVNVDIGGCSFASNGARTVQGSSIGGRLTSLVGTDRSS
jgi:hypothetical protein